MKTKNNFNWFLEGYKKIMASGKDIYFCIDYLTCEDINKRYFILKKRKNGITLGIKIFFEDINLLQKYEKSNLYKRKISVDKIENGQLKVEIPYKIDKSLLETILKRDFCKEE